jgi:hypothetical protein
LGSTEGHPPKEHAIARHNHFRAPLKTSYFGSWRGVKRRKTAVYMIVNEDFEAFYNKARGQKNSF